MKKIAVLLLVNEDKDPKYEFTNEIIRFLNYKKCSVYVEEKHLPHIEGAFPFNRTEDKINFSVILGGDGTVLNYAHKYRDLSFPFYGINLGRVGCLTEARKDQYTVMLDEILRGNYFVEERNSIKCEIESSHGNQTLVAFNEVSVNRAKIYKMLLLDMFINDKNETKFYADGVIVATATGSSAYNLSSGGPLLLPSAKNFVITPLCPQLRTITSLVVNDTDKITLAFTVNNVNSNSDKERPVLVADGMKQIELYENDKITITKDSAKLKIIKVDSDVSLFEPMYKVTYSTNNLFGKK